MDVIARCYRGHIRTGGVTVRGPTERSRRPSLRHGADLRTAERVFVWPIGSDLTKRGCISDYRPGDKRFEIQATFDAVGPARHFGNHDLQQRKDGQQVSYYSILQKVNDFRHASIIGLNSNEARFLDSLYDDTADGRVVDGEAEPRDEPSLGDLHTADDDLASDISDIWHDPTLSSETERRALVKTRLGQGPFRTRLIERWGGRCPVTGCSQEQALRASHIKPWRCSTNQERLDSANGLLLTANLDALFDRFLISFDDDGRMLISPQVEFACYEMLGIPGSPVRGLSAEEQGFLAFHRAQAGLS